MLLCKVLTATVKRCVLSTVHVPCYQCERIVCTVCLPLCKALHALHVQHEHCYEITVKWCIIGVWCLCLQW
jgi:hypothetical protein